MEKAVGRANTLNELRMGDYGQVIMYDCYVGCA